MEVSQNSKKSHPVPYSHIKLYIDFRNSGGGRGNFRWGEEIPLYETLGVQVLFAASQQCLCVPSSEFVAWEKEKNPMVCLDCIICSLCSETYIASPMEWHQVRGKGTHSYSTSFLLIFTGSFLVMVMRMVSLGFDLEPRGDTSPKVSSPPSFGEYMGYCLFPTTSVFGPFLVFSEHMKFLDPSPLIVCVCVCVVRTAVHVVGYV